MEPRAKAQKNVNVTVPLFLSGFLARVSRQSHLPAKSTKEVQPAVVYRSPGVYLKTDENPGKSQLGDRPMKALRQSSPQMGSLASK